MNNRNRTKLWQGALLSALLVSFVACGDDPKPGPPTSETLAHPVVSVNIGEPGWVLTKYTLLDPNRAEIPLPEKERGHRLSTAWVDADETLWLGYDRGVLYRSGDRGQSWTTLTDGYEIPEVPIISFSMRRPVPRQLTRARDGTLYLATVGRGVMRFDEQAQRWQDATWLIDLTDGNISPLSWCVTPWGETGIATGYVSPRGIIPPWAVEIFGQQLRTLDGPTAEPEQRQMDPQVRFVVDVGTRDGRVVAATMGQGLWELSGNTWTALGPDPAPSDVWAMDIHPRGDIAVLGRAGDVWLLRKSTWTQVRCGSGDEHGADIRWVGDRLLVAAGPVLEDFAPTPLQCPDRGGATVLLAFSQHVNLYHSYRGDTNTDDGFGKDIRIIRTTLEIFDRHPQFHNDWDIENLFSLDDWLPTYAPDILEDIARRVADGTDGVRLMSWNNGLMACEPDDEFGLSVDRGLASLEAFTPGLWTPGVQPQENTYTPAHTALYRAHGIEWMTLFYSGTSFTSFRHEIPLTLAEAHGVLTLESDLSTDTMQVIPVYHHADVMDHGGLANWLRQLRANLSGTVALAIHFDADSETWEGFEAELEAVEAMEADWVVPARLQDIVEQLAPAGTINIRRDLADGAFDSFSSWTEKPVNHRFYTRVVRSRLDDRRARALSQGNLPSAAQGHLDAAMDGRLRTLSTTHFGLANPLLHPEREAAGETVSTLAETRAASALAAVLADATPLGSQVAVNIDVAPVTFLMPVDSALAGATIRTLSSADGAKHWLVGTVAGDATQQLATTTPDMTAGTHPGEGWGPDATGDAALGAMEIAGPRIRLEGLDHRPAITDRQWVTASDGAVLTVLGDWNVGTGGSVRYDWIRFDEDPEAWWVEVTLTYPTIDTDQHELWADVAPLEILLPGADQWTVERPLVTGHVADYTVYGAYDALNYHAADGWVRLLADNAADGVSVTTFAPMRAAPAFLPIRMSLVEDDRTDARLTPFGALWGELLDHRPETLLGTGMAEYASRLVAPQLQSTAAAWDGRSICFVLRLQAATTDDDRVRLSQARDGILLLDATRHPTFRRGCL